MSEQPIQKVSAEALAEHRAKQDAAYARSESPAASRYDKTKAPTEAGAFHQTEG